MQSYKLNFAYITTFGLCQHFSWLTCCCQKPNNLAQPEKFCFGICMGVMADKGAKGDHHWYDNTPWQPPRMCNRATATATKMCVGKLMFFLRSLRDGAACERETNGSQLGSSYLADS